MDSEHPRSITARTTIDELVRCYPAAAEILIRRRMHCVGCEIDRFHTVADACRVYGLSLTSFLAELRRSAGPAQRV
jgi:hybrid cluster-associated redox disulfide protein